MVVILGSASKSQRDCGTVRRRSGGGGRGGVGIESSCLSTISRSVKVMQHNKSVQAPVSVRSQVLGEGGWHTVRAASRKSGSQSL